MVGRVFSVTANSASLRTGPGANYQLVAVLTQGTIVLATEVDPGGEWLRIMTADGTAGFIQLEQLSPNVGTESFEAIGAGRAGAQTPEPSE